jgi:tetratricopeptide (TPR) repeat protein
MRHLGVAVLLLCTYAFADSNYQKARLISITDATKVVQGAAYAAGTYMYFPITMVGINFNVQIGDVIYIGHHDIHWRWSYTATDFTPNSVVEVRFDGTRMYIKRPNGQDCKTLIVSIIDKTDLGTGSYNKPRKEAAKHGQWGRELIMLGDLEGAITQMEVSLRLNPDDVGMHVIFGEALRKTGDKEKALEQFRSAVRLKPKDSLAHALVGRMLLEKGEPEAAVEELRAAAQLDSKSSYAHYNYGAALEVEGNLPQALDEYGRVLKLNRGDSQAQEAIRRVKGKIAGTPTAGGNSSPESEGLLKLFSTLRRLHSSLQPQSRGFRTSS